MAHHRVHAEDPVGTWSANGTWMEIAVNATNVTASPVPPYTASSGDLRPDVELACLYNFITYPWPCLSAKINRKNECHQDAETADL